VLRAAASDLFLLLWNRISPDSPGIEVEGDATLLTLWRERARVRWT
jgi:MDMPI C-terminal domain